MTAISLLVSPFGDAGRLHLRYERAGLAAGELWRLASAHVVHLGFGHTAMNLAALLLIGAIFADDLRLREWWLVAAAAAAGIDTGLYLLDPATQWYVGLSGVLHGLLAAGGLAWLKTRRGPGLLLCGVLAAKIVFEQAVGPVPATRALAGDEVIVNAHLYGALAGAAALGLLRLAPAARSRSV